MYDEGLSIIERVKISELQNVEILKRKIKKEKFLSPFLTNYGAGQIFFPDFDCSNSFILFFLQISFLLFFD